MKHLLRHACDTAKTHAIGSALGLLGAPALQSMARSHMQHAGLILMFHHVAPPDANRLAVNKGLEVMPETLDQVLSCLKAQDYDLVSMDAVPERLANASRGQRRFAALTFDDGARDNLIHAAPVLLRHGAPFTVYVTTGFTSGEAAPWWHVVERAALSAQSLTLETQDGLHRFNTSSRADKERSALALHNCLWRASETMRAEHAASLARQAGLDMPALCRELFMDWAELADIAALPGCSIGAHTRTHPKLAEISESAAMAEIGDARDRIRQRLNREARHLSYPYGVAGCCDAREYELARKAGYATAVTTRRRMLAGSDVQELTSLPRIPINGHYQHPLMIAALVSGLPMALAASLTSRRDP